MNDLGLQNNSRFKQGLSKAMPYVYLSGLIIAMLIIGPSPILYFLFALLAALFILPDKNLLGLFLIVILTMIFERYFTLQGLVIDKTIYKFYLIDIVICLSWLSLLFSRRIGKHSNRILFGWPERLLAVWLILVAAYLIRSLFDINADFAVAFSSFKNYFFYPLLYFLVLASIDSGKKFKDAIHLILLGAIGIIGFIFFGFVSGQGLWTEFTPLSTAGTRYLAGTHAFYLALSAALAVPLFLYGRLRDKSLAAIIFGLWALGIGVSLMRHLWLASAAGLAATFALLGSNLKKSYLAYLSQAGLMLAAIIATLALGASLLYFQGSLDEATKNFDALSTRIATVIDLDSDTSASWRQNIWSNAERIWLTNPVFGVGYGHTMLIDTGDYQSFEEIRNIHNSPLAIAVQMGFVGIIAFIAFVLSVIINALRNIGRLDDLKPYRMGLIAAVIVFLVACLFQPYLETNMVGIWLWILLGFLSTARQINCNDTKSLLNG